jgi:hypothetical protein
MKLHACEDTAASGDIPARWRSPPVCVKRGAGACPGAPAYLLSDELCLT